MNRGIPVLSETPPAPDLTALLKLYQHYKEKNGKIQVAEQYHLQPMHAARMAVIESELLGEVRQAQVSATNFYHGVSLMRRYLGIYFDAPIIRGMTFQSPCIDGPNREGLPIEEKYVSAKQDIAWFDFGHKLGVLDFSNDQYFSWIRNERILIRGDRGEIINHDVTYLADYLTPIENKFVRHQAGANGNLEGNFLKDVQLGDRWYYKNPYIGQPLSDDEIAVAQCLEKMVRYLETGKVFYSLAEASQDHYLSLLYQEAIKSGKPIQAERQPWAEE